MYVCVCVRGCLKVYGSYGRRGGGVFACLHAMKRVCHCVCVLDGMCMSGWAGEGVVVISAVAVVTRGQDGSGSLL